MARRSRSPLFHMVTETPEFGLMGFIRACDWQGCKREPGAGDFCDEHEAEATLRAEPEEETDDGQT